jgi:hypothetical protein
MCDVGTIKVNGSARFGRFVINFGEICRGLHLCSLVGCSQWASLDGIGDGSCILLWELAVALIVQTIVEVAILNQDIVEVVEDLGVKIGFATWLGGAPLQCWLFLIVIRGSVGRRKLVDPGEL